MKYVGNVEREKVLMGQDVTRIIDLDKGEQGSSVCQFDPTTKETVEPKRKVTTRTSAGGKRTPTETITGKTPQRPLRKSLQTPLKRGFNELEAPIAVDPIERHAAEIPRRFRGQYRAVKSGNSRKAAIRVQCLECQGWDSQEVAICTALPCPLYKWRING